jgi:hypothetical protein
MSSATVDIEIESGARGASGDLMSFLDPSGRSLDESQTSAAGILRAALPRDERRTINAEHRQSYIRPQYVPPSEVVRMGERLPAEYIVHTDTWTDTNMEHLMEIAERCAVSAGRHDVEQKRYRLKHTLLTVPSLFLSGLASLVAGVGASQSSSTTSIAAAALAATAGFSQSVINYHEWNIRSNKHGSAAVRFSGLAEHIRALRHLHEERRRSYEVESVYVLMTLSGIMHEEPPLPDPTVSWFQRGARALC